MPVAAFLSLERRRHGLAAVAIGVSLSAKFLPGLVLLPMLVGPIGYALVAAAIPVASFAPAALADWTGLWHNIGYPFFRDPDSTALMFSLTSSGAWAARLAALVAVAWLWLRARASCWRREEALEWVLGAQLALLLVGSTLHNNYLVWLLPYFGMIATVNERSALEAERAATLLTDRRGSMVPLCASQR